jgi:glucose-6-phosphate 1-epimerase
MHRDFLLIPRATMTTPNTGASAPPVGAAITDFQGQPAVHLRSPDGARATVLLHGGHLVSWVPAGGSEMLYLSPRSAFGGTNAVRGGVPVVFPQFSTRGPLPRHGFARNRPWALLEQSQRGRNAFAVFGLSDDEATRAIWPQPFSLELTVSIEVRRLEIELAVVNTGDINLSFHAALHTYLRCNDVIKTQLEGLMDRNYLDQTNGEERNQWVDVVTVAKELDRIYFNAPAGPLTLRELGRRLQISQRGFADTVVWNPGPERCAQLADMPPDGWAEMMCVEAAQIGDAVTLSPGDEWSGMQTLEAAG